MSYPLTKAQVQFQKIKREEKRRAALLAQGKLPRNERRDAFLECRRKIEERISQQLQERGLEINLNAVRNLSFDLAKKEMRS